MEAVPHATNPTACRGSDRAQRLVLLVEDDPELQGALSTLLRLEGYPTIEAAQGHEALAILQGAAMKPQVIVLDWMMPVMTGKEFMERVQHEPALQKIPVVVLSGAHGILSSTTPYPQIKSVLEKPVSLIDLMTVIDECTPTGALCHE